MCRSSSCAFASTSTLASASVVGSADDAGLEGVRHRLLRWSACLAAAEAYQLEGFDAVVHDVVTGGHLEDFLDLAAPETVHVVVLDDPRLSATPRWGLWLDPTASPPGNVADAVLSHLETARVPTVESDDDSASPD